MESWLYAAVKILRHIVVVCHISLEQFVNSWRRLMTMTQSRSIQLIHLTLPKMAIVSSTIVSYLLCEKLRYL